MPLRKQSKKNTENIVAYYNLDNAYTWHQEPNTEKIFECLKEAEKLAPSWPVVLIASAKSKAQKAWHDIMASNEYQIWQIEELMKEVKNELKQIEKELNNAEKQPEMKEYEQEGEIGNNLEEKEALHFQADMTISDDSQRLNLKLNQL